MSNNVTEGFSKFSQIRGSDHARQHLGHVYNQNTYNYNTSERENDNALNRDKRQLALLKAASRGQTKRINHLLTLGVDIDYVDGDGYSALHHAVFSGYQDTVQALIDAGADIDVYSAEFGTPLCLAALESRHSALDVLLMNRADVNAKGGALVSPIHAAFIAGDGFAVDKLQRWGAQFPGDIIVGVDFGKFYTRVAFSYRGYQGDTEFKYHIETIRGWPCGSAQAHKVPSEITYFSGTPSWGFEIDRDYPRISLLRLLLGQGTAYPVNTEAALEQLSRCGRDAHTVVADFLKQLFTHTRKQILRGLGPGVSQSKRLRVVFVKPYECDDVLRDAIEKTAESALLAVEGKRLKIALIPKLETVARGTLQMRSNDRTFGGGDIFVVCDVRFLNVKLSAFRICRLVPFGLEEVGKFASHEFVTESLERQFTAYVESKMGALNFRHFCSIHRKAWDSARQYFNYNIVRDYDPSCTSRQIPLAGALDDPVAGISRGTITVSSRDCFKLYAPVMNRVTQLVQEQINMVQEQGKIVSGIVLAGRLGSIKWFLSGLRDSPEMESTKLPWRRFQIIQPDDDEVVSVRGAVMRGLQCAE